MFFPVLEFGTNEGESFGSSGIKLAVVHFLSQRCATKTEKSMCVYLHLTFLKRKVSFNKLGSLSRDQRQLFLSFKTSVNY